MIAPARTFGLGVEASVSEKPVAPTKLSPGVVKPVDDWHVVGSERAANAAIRYDSHRAESGEPRGTA